MFIPTHSPFKMHKFHFALILCLLSLAFTVQADEVRYYDIEAVIFESLDPSARQSENWKSDAARPIPQVTAELDQPYPGAIPKDYNPKLTFKTLPARAYQLNTEEKLLSKSNEYRILMHIAWVQPGMPPDSAIPVHINRSYLTDTPVAHTLAPAGGTDTGVPGAAPASAAQTGQSRAVLDGYIKIILTRYLHADVDLTYSTGLPLNPQNLATNPDAAISPQNPPPVVYRLLESRRMRSKELHYLDHPVLGMLLLITPHETTN